MEAADLYRAVCEYLKRNGWEREHDTAWWHRLDSEGDPIDEQPMYDALREQLMTDSIDIRQEPDPLTAAADHYTVTQVVRTPDGRWGVLRAGIEWDTAPIAGTVDDMPF